MLSRRGHDILVVCSEDGPLPKRLRQTGIAVEIIPFGGSTVQDIFHILTATIRLIKLLRRYRPDVVHCHLIKAMVVGRIAAAMARVPVCISQLGGPLPLEITPLRYLDLSTAWLDKTIIASSNALCQIYKRYAHTRKKVVLNYYGFDLSQFLEEVDGMEAKQEFSIPPDVPVIGMVAHIYKSRLKRFRKIGIKGHEVFLAAVPLVLSVHSDTRFVIVGGETFGDGTYMQKLKSMAQHLQVSERVIFTGFRSDVPRLIAAMDLVAVPSLSENVGGAVEPLLMCKPVVASNVGGLPDVVINNRTGLLVPPNDPIALADALNAMLSLPKSAREAMGAIGREEVILRFELAHTIDRLEAIYQIAVARCKS